MNSTPQGTVSVIMPAYNSQRYLTQSIESVLRGQESVPLELIIVNDGSADATAAIAGAYAATDPRVRVITQPNAGLSAARNAGLDAATGEYVAFIDSDDLMLPGALAHLLSLFDEGTDVVSGRYYRGKTRAAAHFGSEGRDRMLSLTGREAVIAMLYQRGMSSNAWGRIYRRAAIGTTRFTPGIYYEDIDFNYRLFPRLRRLRFSSRHVYFYRDAPGSITGVWSRKRLDVMRVTADIEADAEARRDPALLASARDRRLAASFNMYALASIHGDRDAARSCWSQIKRLRGPVSRDRHIRLKDRLGILASHLGPAATTLLSRLAYRR
ncbi:MAG: glycosyltransferase [Candidatus Amulumruptor caecigallinarius]|nr:glycosyltransferase [Candidatus Amulumruptor caecigallinarius]MCM1397785.1 glycosyltransferase [Candidatus Amulumruptor caecigallinarius]MCM1454824.1 glycosyltransferase [bacterium]